MDMVKITDDHFLITRIPLVPGIYDLWATPFLVADFNRQTESDCSRGENFYCEIGLNSHSISQLIPKIDSGRLHVCDTCWGKIVMLAQFGFKEGFYCSLVHRHIVDLSNSPLFTQNKENFM